MLNFYIKDVVVKQWLLFIKQCVVIRYIKLQQEHMFYRRWPGTPPLFTHIKHRVTRPDFYRSVRSERNHFVWPGVSWYLLITRTTATASDGGTLPRPLGLCTGFLCDGRTFLNHGALSFYYCRKH